MTSYLFPLLLFAFIECVCLTFSDCSQRAAFRDPKKMKRHKHFEMVTRLFTYHPIPPGLISVKAEKPGVEWHCLPAWAHKFRFEWEWRALLYCDCGTNRCLNGCMKLFSVLIVAYFYSPHTTEGGKRGRGRGSSEAASACPNHWSSDGFKGENETRRAAIVTQ